MARGTVCTVATLLFGGSVAVGQTSSLSAQRRAQQADVPPAEAALQPADGGQIRPNVVYEQFSWITARPLPPKSYKVHDLVTIIIRESKSFEADADLKSESDYQVESTLDAFFKPIDGGIGSTTFARGKPNIDYEWKSKLRNKGDTSRSDKFTTRITAEVIDIKPNGLLVLEGRAYIEHDEETSEVMLSGTCRKEDIAPDNTVLSTQIADKRIVAKNEGAVGAAARRGWLAKIVDFIKPF